MKTMTSGPCECAESSPAKEPARSSAGREAGFSVAFFPARSSGAFKHRTRPGAEVAVWRFLRFP